MRESKCAEFRMYVKYTLFIHGHEFRVIIDGYIFHGFPERSKNIWDGRKLLMAKLNNVQDSYGHVQCTCSW